MSSTLILALTLSGAVAFNNEAYQYVYEYPDNSVKMLMPKAVCTQGCETTLQITYNSDAPLNAAAAGAALSSLFTSLGLTTLFYVAPAPSPAPPSHHTVHGHHTPHNVMPPPTPHVPSLHDMAMDLPMGMGAGGGTVIAPMNAPAPDMGGMGMNEPHASTMGMPAQKSLNKASFVLSYLVSSLETCGDMPDYEGFANNPEIIGLLSLSLGATVTNIAFVAPSCSGCTEFLAGLAEVCPPTAATPELCQNVHTAQLCNEPANTDTVQSASVKVDCQWDLSTPAGLDEYFTANC